MTLAKKGTREMIVSGRKYRWRVARAKVQNKDFPSCRLTVEEVESKRVEQQDFKLDLDATSTSGSFRFASVKGKMSVTPEAVRQFIVERFVETGKR